MKTPIILILLFLGLSSSSQIPNSISSQEKIFGLSKFWSEAMYNFPYFAFLTNVNFDSIYMQSVKETLDSKNDYEYYLSLQKFAASFQDNHTYVQIPDYLNPYYTFSEFGDFFLVIKQIDGKAIITHTCITSKEYIPAGSEIIEVDSTAVNKYLKTNICPYLSSSSDFALEKVGTQYLLQGIKGTSVLIKIKTPEGKIKSIELKRSSTRCEELFPRIRRRNFYQVVERNIAYLTIDDFADRSVVDSLISYLPEIRKAKGLIIDIRENGGGSSSIAKNIAQYFIEDSMVYGSRGKTRKNLGYNRYWGFRVKNSTDTIANKALAECYLMAKNLLLEDLNQNIMKNSIKSGEKIIIPTVILTSYMNGSASEEFLLYLENQKHIKFIGERTSGGNGQPMLFSMPGGGIASVCTQYCYKSDGSDYYRVGIVPEIEIEQTLDDFINEIDTVKKFAQQFLVKIIEKK
jgi:C-terminal processing protease CtpA/Prc